MLKSKNNLFASVSSVSLTFPHAHGTSHTQLKSFKKSRIQVRTYVSVESGKDSSGWHSSMAHLVRRRRHDGSGEEEEEEGGVMEASLHHRQHHEHPGKTFRSTHTQTIESSFHRCDEHPRSDAAAPRGVDVFRSWWWSISGRASNKDRDALWCVRARVRARMRACDIIVGHLVVSRRSAPPVAHVSFSSSGSPTLALALDVKTVIPQFV